MGFEMVTGVREIEWANGLDSCRLRTRGRGDGGTCRGDPRRCRTRARLAAPASAALHGRYQRPRRGPARPALPPGHRTGRGGRYTQVTAPGSASPTPTPISLAAIVHVRRHVHRLRSERPHARALDRQGEATGSSSEVPDRQSTTRPLFRFAELAERGGRPVLRMEPACIPRGFPKGREGAMPHERRIA